MAEVGCAGSDRALGAERDAAAAAEGHHPRGRRVEPGDAPLAGAAARRVRRPPAEGPMRRAGEIQRTNDSMVRHLMVRHYIKHHLMVRHYIKHHLMVRHYI